MEKHMLIWADSNQVFYTVSNSEQIREEDWIRLLSGELELYEVDLTKIEFEK